MTPKNVRKAYKGMSHGSQKSVRCPYNAGYKMYNLLKTVRNKRVSVLSGCSQSWVPLEKVILIFTFNFSFTRKMAKPFSSSGEQGQIHSLDHSVTRFTLNYKSSGKPIANVLHPGVSNGYQR